VLEVPDVLAFAPSEEDFDDESDEDEESDDEPESDEELDEAFSRLRFFVP
jgi:hypothetical protein